MVKASVEFKKGVVKQRQVLKKMSWTQLVLDPTPIIVIAGVIGISFYSTYYG